jgi:hypothetical protein
MLKLLPLIALLALPVSHASERMADVAVFIHSVWFAEEFNERCPESPIQVPVAETELRRLLVLADGGNFVDLVDRDPNVPDSSARDNMKDLARESAARGCDSETSATLRERVKMKLAVPELITELLQDARELELPGF